MPLIFSLAGIGDLIIDLDADIEKSSSSNLDSSLVIPLQSAANLSANATIDNKSQVKESTKSAETNKASVKAHSKGEFLIKNFYLSRDLIEDLQFRQERADNDGIDNKYWETRSIEDVN